MSEELYFHGNDARNSEGGALHISNGELELTEDSAVVFESNQGRCVVVGVCLWCVGVSDILNAVRPHLSA